MQTKTIILHLELSNEDVTSEQLVNAVCGVLDNDAGLASLGVKLPIEEIKVIKTDKRTETLIT